MSVRSWKVDALLAGKATPFGRGEKSAIGKRPLAGPVAIETLGLAEDEQADRVHHGGPDMAVHLYPLDHYAFWRGEIGDHSLLADPGAFGSNLAISGITENDVHIGDRFALGTAVLEISQPRKPCWKIEHRFGTKHMVAAIIKTGRCGWYFRVVEEGHAQAGDTLRRIASGNKLWTVSRAFKAIWGGKTSDSDRVDLIGLTALSAELRERYTRQLK